MSEENNHIEQFFKKHLEVEQASFMEEDWAKMEAKLDAAGLGASGTNGGGIGIRKGLVILLLATSIAFILGWFLKDYGQETDNLSVKDIEENGISEVIAIEKDQQMFTDKDGDISEFSNTTTSKAERLNQAEQQSNEAQTVTSSSSSTAANETQKNSIKSDTSTEQITDSEKSATSKNTENRFEKTSTAQLNSSLGSENNYVGIKKESSITSTVNEEEQAQTGRTSEFEEDSKNSYEANALEVFNENPNQEMPSSGDTRSVTNNIVEKDNDALVDEEKVLLPTHQLMRLSGDSLVMVQQERYQIQDSVMLQALTGKIICLTAPRKFQWKNVAVGLSYAPDFNSLNFKGKLKATNKVGLRLFWKPLKRFELQSGIFFNEKKYTSPGDEYHPPAGYWGSNTNGIVPEWVNGSCSVIDIPVTLGIDVIQTTRWNWSVNGGLSNYILLDEKYIYEFDQPNPNTAWGWETNENTTLKWSVMNASIGGEFLWRSKTSLRIEPFIQMPLQEIGWAKVSLYGYGVLFTIKQNLFTYNRRKIVAKTN
ncbi:MAG: hypothetical protein CMB80_20230 [Flammeovirgaceae bacterium]|nr:hypothetical protein [Flammeovirgaceae bacterium]MBE61031.1 hypothetical protein [Flammeovirgaceae bacterium]HCX21076.1 hypothetical protein [Cytophagales bacterium]